MKKSIIITVAIIFVAINIPILAAYEAHVIGVTARIVDPYDCFMREVKTIGYWKNHSDVYDDYLPQNLGDEIILTVQQANEIFDNANANEMRDMLLAQLLATKFNIAVFAVGNAYIESEGKTIQEIVDEADDMLRLVPEPDQATLEAMKNLLDDINNLQEVEVCYNTQEINHLVINEFYYDTVGVDANEEWIEIYNPTDQVIDLSNYKIGDEETIGGGEGMYQFPEGSSISPDEFLIIVQKATGFNTLYGFNPDFEITDTDGGVPNMIKYLAWASGNIALDNSGDEILLLDGGDAVVDAVTYEDGVLAGVIPHPGVITDHSLAREPKGYDTDDCSNDFVDLEIPTPGTNPHQENIIPTNIENQEMNINNLDNQVESGNSELENSEERDVEKEKEFIKKWQGACGILPTPRMIEVGVYGIGRDIEAEQDFVKNWQGKEGRLPTTNEIICGVY